jgi:hypothetical protein
MAFLSDLWLPIVLASVFVFVASSIIHMLLPVHSGDFKPLPNEDPVLDAMRSPDVAPGQYMLPGVREMADLAKPEVIEKYKRGPVGFLTIVPAGPPAMGKNLVQWFLYSVLVSLFSGYVAWHGLGRGAHYLDVFRVAGSVALAAYAIGPIPNSIWWGAPWKNTAKFIFDGVVYGLVTAGTFGWLWPSVTG